jgi:hypothetical protein
MVAGDVGRRPDGIEDLQIGVADEPECLPALLSASGRGAQRPRRGRGRRTPDDLPAADAIHYRVPSSP